MATDSGRVDAATALDLVAASRAGLADRIVTPWWYHPALGLLVGGLVAVQAVPSLLARNVFLVGYAVGLGLLVSAYRKQTGLWVNALRSRSARRWVLAFVVAAGSLIVGSLGLHAGLGWSAAPVLAGALMVPLTVVLGRRVDAALRAALRGSSR